MAQPQDHISMALFCDFENVALGVRDANYEKFDIKRVLERLLLKGSIVVKKAYCDWERYKSFKAAMHEANFELIEIPHVRQSGKNSADIRLVVDALDLCYTKSHVNTFVIISGDSDFSPLVSKLRENAKYVIGVGVKQSTSDLLIANCDEFIFYDDLVRESQRQRSRDNRDAQPQQRRSPEEEKRRREEMDARRTKVVEMAAETYEALVTDRDEGGRVWASVLKEALKRRNPGFSEQYYGFRTFGNLLEEAQARGLLELGRDEKSGLFVSRGNGVPLRVDSVAPQLASQLAPQDEGVLVQAEQLRISTGEEAGTVLVQAHEPQEDGAAVGTGEAGGQSQRAGERNERGERGERGERSDRAERGERGERGGRGRRGGRRGRGEDNGGAQPLAQQGSEAAPAAMNTPVAAPAAAEPAYTEARPAPAAVREHIEAPAPAAATTPAPAEANADAPAAPKARKTASKTGRTARKTAAKTAQASEAAPTPEAAAPASAAAGKTPSKKTSARGTRSRQSAAKKSSDKASDAS